MNRSIVFAAILISAAVLLNGFFERRGHVVSTNTVTAVATSPDQAIAVLPFTGLDAADPNNSLAAGIRREIVTRLTAQHVRAASVEESPRVGQLLIGSIQRQGNIVRINVQLVDAASRDTRWTETYDRHIDDVFAIESEIAESVAKSVVAQKT